MINRFAEAAALVHSQTVSVTVAIRLFSLLMRIEKEHEHKTGCLHMCIGQ